MYSDKYRDDPSVKQTPKQRIEPNIVFNEWLDSKGKRLFVSITYLVQDYHYEILDEHWDKLMIELNIKGKYQSLGAEIAHINLMLNGDSMVRYFTEFDIPYEVYYNFDFD